MALYKRGNIWWIIISHCGERIQQTTGTTDKKAAQQYHDRLKAQLWKREKLDEKPKHTWKEAVIRWFVEMQHKRSLRDDKRHMRWLDCHFGNLDLSEITKDKIDEVARKRENEGVSSASVIGYLPLLAQF